MAKKHVMLSYQWDDQKLVTDVYNYLTKQKGMNVWMDTQGGMKANIYQWWIPDIYSSTIACYFCLLSMADGVQGADVVVCFLTAKYQESKNCQQELQFARDCKVPIVPCRIQSLWKPSSWLGIKHIFTIFSHFFM